MSHKSIMTSPLPPESIPPSLASRPTLLPILSDPSYYAINTWSRLPKQSTGEDGFTASTLGTPSTIPHCLTLRRRDLFPESIPASPPTWPSPTADPNVSEPLAVPPDVYMMFDLAAPGVCGHPSTAHGGVVATCIDEAMSLAISVYGAPARSPSPGEDAGQTQDEDGPRGALFTTQLDIRYKRPVKVPGVLVVRAKVVARVGRKFWVRAHACQSDGHELVVATDAMAFWLQTGEPASSRL